ncbi:ankyrin repeat-containing domain protein [Nemania sp. FL0031]|nr:ankyrin repeat-containing domain protein [Nemania sp. FL0031]
MPWADVLQLVASGVSIVDCSYRLAKFLKELNDDVRDIQNWLIEMKASLDTLQKVLDLVRKVAENPNMKHTDDDSIELICTIIKNAESQAANILQKLPRPPGNGVIPKLESVFRKLMTDRAIKEHEFAILKWAQLLHMTVGALTWERTTHFNEIQDEGVPLPPYQPRDDDLKNIRLEVDAMLRGIPVETASTSTGFKPFLSIIDKAKGQETRWYESKVAALESERRFLEAATEQGNIINLHRAMIPHTPFTPHDEAILVEKQADYLLRCFTLGRYFEAATLLQSFIENRGLMLTDEENARIILKIGELYMDGRKIKHINDTTRLVRAEAFLVRAATLLGNLNPPPYELYLRSVKCLVWTLETLNKPADAQQLKAYLEKQLSDNPDTRLDHHIDWDYTEGPESRALAWCRSQTNLAFNVDSLEFRFDSIVQGTSAFHSAVREGQIGAVKEMLVEVEQIDILDSARSTPLLIAAERRHAEIFQLLLDRNASLNEVDNLRQTVLHKCQTSARGGQDVAIAKLILDGELEPNFIDSKDSTGKTALLMACENSNEKMVEFLLDHNADPTIPSTKNQTPLQAAVEMRSSEGSRRRQASRLRIIEMLLKRGADSNQRNNLGNTPLHTAASHGDVEVVKLLLEPEYKTEVDLPGRNDQTPIAAAVEHTYIVVVEELVAKGANVASKGVFGNGKSAEEWARGYGNKALRNALQPEGKRRMSESSSMRTAGRGTRSSTSSDSSSTRFRSFLTFGREPRST